MNASVVVVARDHNPTILHPAFLESQGIVRSDWQLAEPPICVPPASVVKYANGIVFTVDLNRFQVLDNGVPEEILGGRVRELAIAYIDRLPHVRYTAVGVNFRAFAEHADPERFLIDRFLKPGPWNSSPIELRSAVCLSQGRCHTLVVLRLRDSQDEERATESSPHRLPLPHQPCRAERRPCEMRDWPVRRLGTRFCLRSEDGHGFGAVAWQPTRWKPERSALRRLFR